MTAALRLVEGGRSPDDQWRSLRTTMHARLRELRSVDQRYAVLRFHATRADGGGYITEPDMTGDLAASHQYEIHALGLCATGAGKPELVANFMRALGNLTETP